MEQEVQKNLLVNERRILSLVLQEEGNNARLGSLLRETGSFSKLLERVRQSGKEGRGLFGRGPVYQSLYETLWDMVQAEDEVLLPPCGLSVNDPVDKVLMEIRKQGIRLVFWEEEDFPALIRQIPSPPAVLFYRGDLSLVRHPAVAIVGARRASEYGKRVAYEVAMDACQKGIVVVSGLALGIDRAAHMGALDAGGKTIAVMPGGAEACYPRANEWLFHRILDKGLVLSEYPPGADFQKGHFVERNRLVSGLSLATVVCEAGPKSGSVITAQFAADQGRDVYVVPGSLYATSFMGSHHLIRDGANLLMTIQEVADDILKDGAEQLQLAQTKERQNVPLGGRRIGRKVAYRSKEPLTNREESQEVMRRQLMTEEKRQLAGAEAWLYEQLDDFGKSPELLCLETRRNVREVSTALTMLEIRGLAKRTGGLIVKK